MNLPFNDDAARRREAREGSATSRAAFDEPNSQSPTGRRTTRTSSTRMKAIGLRLEPFELPKLPLNVTGGILGAESGASFDEFVRTGRDKDLTNKARSNGMRQSRVVPAVEYLQAQRVRAMIMRQFADVVSKFDVYVAPYIDMRSGSGRSGESGRSGGRAGRRRRRRARFAITSRSRTCAATPRCRCRMDSPPRAGQPASHSSAGRHNRGRHARRCARLPGARRLDTAASAAEKLEVRS